MSISDESFQDESFDVVPRNGSFDASSPLITPPADLLTANKVNAVRFHPTKPGYAFQQVEAFVEQVTETLKYLEQKMHSDQVALHDLQEDIDYLQERNLTLQATIEVFRAKGDPVSAPDGSYLTESGVQNSQAMADLTAQLNAALAERDAAYASLQVMESMQPATTEPQPDPALNAQLAAAIAERDAAITALQVLQADLTAAKEDADVAWKAESDLRDYVENTLLPWVEAQKQAGFKEEPSPAEETHEDVPAETSAEQVQPQPEDQDFVDNLLDLWEEKVQEQEASAEALPEAAPNVETLEMLDEEDLENEEDFFQYPEQHVPAAEPPAEQHVPVVEPVIEPVTEQEEAVAVEEVSYRETMPTVLPAAPSHASPFTSVSSASNDWDDEEVAQAPSQEPQIADWDEQPVAQQPPRVGILASSPEVAALGGQVDLAAMPEEADVQNDGPRRAGAPLPDLLSSAPEFNPPTE